jgi:hypothetical protein
MLCSLLSMVSSVGAILKTGLSEPWHENSLYVVYLFSMVSSMVAILKNALSGPWHKDSHYVV